MNKSIAVIINSSSGANEIEILIASLRKVFNQHALEPELFLVHPGMNVIEVAQKALSTGHKIIAAGGGDGTINAVASQLLNTDAALAILPLGTFNHLAQDLNIPLDLNEAVAVLSKGHKKNIDAAFVNDRLFLNNSSIGMYSKLVGFRKNYQKHGWSKRIALLQALGVSILKYSFLNVEIQIDGKSELHKTPLVFVGNNQYEVEGFDFGTRLSIESGTLCVYTIEHRSRLDLIKLGLHALAGKLSDHDQFNSYLTTQVALETRKPQLRVAIDGETISLTTPLRYEVKPKALTVIVP